jgi:hypothetical protein
MHALQPAPTSPSDTNWDDISPGVLFGAGAAVDGQFLATLTDYRQRRRVASFSIDQVVKEYAICPRVFLPRVCEAAFGPW